MQSCRRLLQLDNASGWVIKNRAPQPPGQLVEVARGGVGRAKVLQPVINEEMELRRFLRMLSLCARDFFIPLRNTFFFSFSPFSKTRRHCARKFIFWFSFVFLFECGRSETMHCYPNGRKDIMVDVKKKKKLCIYSDSIVCSLYFQNKYIHVFFAVFF